MSERPRLAPVAGLTKATIPTPPPKKRANPPASSTPTAAPAKPTPSGNTAAGERPRLTVADEPDKRAPAPARATARPRKAAAGSALQPISVTLPVQIRDSLREQARRRPETTQVGILLEAVQANVDKLTRLVEAERSRSNGADPSGIFPAPVQGRSRSDETRVVHTLRVAAANLAVIDDLVVEHNAENRTQLITAVLRVHLTN